MEPEETTQGTRVPRSLTSGHFHMLLCLLLNPFSSILCLVKNCPSELRSEFTSVRKLSLTTLHPKCKTQLSLRVPTTPCYSHYHVTDILCGSSRFFQPIPPVGTVSFNTVFIGSNQSPTWKVRNSTYVERNNKEFLDLLLYYVEMV